MAAKICPLGLVATAGALLEATNLHTPCLGWFPGSAVRACVEALEPEIVMGKGTVSTRKKLCLQGNAAVAAPRIIGALNRAGPQSAAKRQHANSQPLKRMSHLLIDGRKVSIARLIDLYLGMVRLLVPASWDAARVHVQP